MPSSAKGFALYAAFRTFLGIGSRLPFTLTRSIGPLLSGAAMQIMSGPRTRIRTHLEIAFPELDAAARDAIAAACSRHFGLMLAEITWMRRASPEQIIEMCGAAGLDRVARTAEEGRGAILATGHCGNWELLGARLPLGGVPLVPVARELDDPRLDRLITASRSRFGAEVVHRGPSAGRQLVRALGANKIIALLIDQDIRDVPGVFVPFFGRPAWTPSGLATLALRLRSPVLAGFNHRRPDGTHLLEIHPPLPVPEGGSLEDRVQELTAAATAAVERQIRAHPEQWVWMHRRWRRQPEPGGSQSKPT